MLNYIGCVDIVITALELLGQYQQTGTAPSPLKITLADSQKLQEVERNQRDFRKVFVKKYLDPVTRK